MQHSLTLTLAAWTDFIWIALVVASVIGSWIGNAKKKHQAQRRIDEGPDTLEIEEMAARRREQLQQTSRQRAQTQMQSGDAVEQPATMSMAERIARARAKAQQEQSSQGEGRPVEISQDHQPNEAQRRVLAQRQAELNRRRQLAAAEAQQRAQLQAQRRAQKQAQQRARQQHAQSHAQVQSQARRSGKLLHEPVPVSKATTASPRQVARDRSAKRAKPTTQPVLISEVTELIPRGTLSRADLRRAIVLKEILDKPIALRDTQVY
jgi:hypothetical protein